MSITNITATPSANPLKDGDTIKFTITADSNTLTASNSTANGTTLTNFVNNNDNTYCYTYTHNCNENSNLPIFTNENLPISISLKSDTEVAVKTEFTSEAFATDCGLPVSIADIKACTGDEITDELALSLIQQTTAIICGATCTDLFCTKKTALRVPTDDNGRGGLVFTLDDCFIKSIEKVYVHCEDTPLEEQDEIENYIISESGNVEIPYRSCPRTMFSTARRGCLYLDVVYTSGLDTVPMKLIQVFKGLATKLYECSNITESVGEGCEILEDNLKPASQYVTEYKTLNESVKFQKSKLAEACSSQGADLISNFYDNVLCNYRCCKGGSIGYF